MNEESQSVLDQIYDYYQDDFKNTLTLENILHESDDDTNLSMFTDFGDSSDLDETKRLESEKCKQNISIYLKIKDKLKSF
jgi:hypothetical protein